MGMDKTIVNRTLRWGTLSSLILSWAAASADPWDFGLNIDLGVIYTDNVFLADDGLEESETAYTIAPEFVLSKDSERLQADVRYRPEGYFYSDFSDANDVYHVLNAALTGVLVKERLFLKLDAANYQSIVTPEGRYPTTNLPITGNRVDSSTFGVRPYWQQSLGSAKLLLEAGLRRVDYDGDQFQSSDEKDGHFRLDNIESQQGLAWALDYQYRRMEYEISLPYEYQQASLNLGFWLNGTFRIFAEGGVETPYDAFLESDMDADFWEAGFQYKPNQRMDLEVAAGDRSYGESYRGRLSYKLRRGSMTASYSEGPTTRADEAFDRRPITGTDNLDGILDRPGRSDRYIRRRAAFSATIELAKSDLTVRVFGEQRDLRTTADGEPLPDEDFAGAAVRWSWNMGTKTTLGIGADISKRDQVGGKDDLFRASVDLAYQFSQRLSLRAEAIRSDQKRGETGEFDYEENQVRLYLSSEF
jgi:hypothetical protein